jgi:hypothetical protein
VAASANASSTDGFRATPVTRNPAQLRGDVQRGVTGDKRAGFDPAAAPLETDAEAAGTPLGPEHTELGAQAHIASAGHAADSYDNAMLSVADAKPKTGITPLVLYMVAFMAIVLFGAVLASVLRG